MANARRCIFYRTLPIDDDSRSGSGVRPAKLLRAFRDLGYQVDVVDGRAGVRASAANAVKKNLKAGVEYDFVYAEPPTTPILLNEPHHLPTHPFLDYGFLARCRSAGVPVVLFYCDVQWRLQGYPARIGWPKYLAALPFFHLDLLVYRRVVDALLVPDLRMLSQIAGWTSKVPHWASIPGFDPQESPPAREAMAPDLPLRLFYVGGVEPPVYDLTPLLAASARAIGKGLRHEVTICCREAEWARRSPAYERFLGHHIRVVHNRSRGELLDLYSRHDVAVMPYGTPNSDWAMPIKFPEAIGMGLPVLAGTGTAVARMVAAQGLGWTLGTSADDDLSNFLRTVDRSELDRVMSAVARDRVDRGRGSWAPAGARGRAHLSVSKEIEP